MDLDIFSLFSWMCPLQKNERGIFEPSGQTAWWMYSDIMRWFLIRSLPLTRMSNGYQYSNSWRSFCSFSSSIPHSAGYFYE